MKKIRRDKEFSTETLVDVNYDPEEVRAYDNGEAPVSRHTQTAAELDDLVEFQRRSKSQDDLSKTHNYNVLNAVRDYDPDEGRRREPDEGEQYDEPVEAEADDLLAVDDAPGNPLLDDDTNDYTEEFKGSVPDEEPAEDEQAIEDFSDFDDEVGDDYEPRPIRPDDAGYEDIMEQFTNEPTKPKYWFEEFGDYWTCSCGHLNKGEYCDSCGLSRELLRTLFVLRKPGDYEVPIKYEEVIIPKGRLSTKQKLAIAIAIIAIMLAVGRFFTYYYLIVPAMEKEEAANIKTTTETVQAGVADVSKETDSFLWNSYLTAGDNCMDNKKYRTAMGYYHKARQIDNTTELKDKVLEAKYKYVGAHKDEGGETFEKYLDELMAIDYKEVSEIYNSYYAWNVRVVANLKKKDYDTDLDKASRADTIYFHVSVSGGPPDGLISVYYEAVWPSGHKQTDLLGDKWTDGSRGYAKFAYPVPPLGQEGTLTFNIYDRSTQELLASDSIELEK